MRRLIVAIVLTLSVPAFAHAGNLCEVELAALTGKNFSVAQVAMTRELLTRIVPAARTCTLVPFGEIEAGLAMMGHKPETTAFAEYFDRLVHDPVVRAAEYESPLRRAMRALESIAEDPEAFSTCLIHEKAASEVLSVYIARDFTVNPAPAGAGPTFEHQLFKSVPQASRAHGYLIIEPSYYLTPGGWPRLRESLIRAASTFEVTRALHTWACANGPRVTRRHRPGLLRYIGKDREAWVVDAGLAQLLLFTQATLAAVQANPMTATNSLLQMRRTIAHFPEARAFAARLGIDLASTDVGPLSKWSQRTMSEILNQR